MHYIHTYCIKDKYAADGSVALKHCISLLANAMLFFGGRSEYHQWRGSKLLVKVSKCELNMYGEQTQLPRQEIRQNIQLKN